MEDSLIEGLENFEPVFGDIKPTQSTATFLNGTSNKILEHLVASNKVRVAGCFPALVVIYGSAENMLSQ